MQPNQIVKAFESVQKHDMTSTLKNQLNIILVEYVPHQNLLVHGSVFLLSMHGYEPYNSTILLLPRTAFVPIQPRRQQSLLHLPNPMQPFCLQNIPPVALGCIDKIYFGFACEGVRNNIMQQQPHYVVFDNEIQSPPKFGRTS